MNSSPRFRRLVFGVVLAYLVAMIAAWLIMTQWGDVYALPTLLLFGPRWVLALPLVVLLPAVVIARSWRSWLLLLASIIVLTGPINGFETNPLALTAGSSTDPVIRVVSLNCAGHMLNQDKFLQVMTQLAPDVILTQETPRSLTGETLGGWSFERGANQTAIFSRHPLQSISQLDENGLGEWGGTLRVDVQAPLRTFPICNVHLPTPRDGIGAVIRKKLSGLTILEKQIEVRSQASRSTRNWSNPTAGLIVGGDFNMPVESAIYERDWGHFTNAFSEVGRGFGWTKIKKQFGIRIDHILCSRPWKVLRCWVGPDLGSDHLPVIADLTVRD